MNIISQKLLSATQKAFKNRIILSMIIMIFLAPLLILIISNLVVNSQSDNFVYNEVESLPYNKVGLILGTSKFTRSGRENPYFKNRIEAADKLFKAGKIKYIIVSGDNSKKYYNEPQDMKDELIKRGVPDKNIYLDYAGFRTFDSIYRIREIFGQSSFTIISQEFHNRRAIYIANNLNLKAVGYNAKDIDIRRGLKTTVREYFARVKVIGDILFDKKPKFLGEKINID